MSLRPIKGNRRHRSHAPRLEGGSWGAKRKSEFTDFRKWGKIGILATVIIVGVLAGSYGYYSNVYLPNRPSPSSTNYDPFTLLWNGTVTQGSGQANSVMWSNANAPTDIPSTGLGQLITRYAECFTVTPSSQTLNRFSISLKRIGSPTGFLTGRFWDNALASPGPGSHNCIPNSLGWADSSSGTVDLSTVPTSYTTYTFNLNNPVANGFQYAVGIWLTCSPACSDTNEVIAGISNTAPANQNAATFDQFAGWSCAEPGPPGCPTGYDYQFSVFYGFSCGSGYQCQNAALSPTGNILGLQAQATATLDSFHPVVNDFFGTARGAVFASFYGESFVISGPPSQIASVQFMMNKTKPWTGAIVAQIWSIVGIPGVSALPAGTQPNSGKFPVGALSSSTAVTDSTVMPTNATAAIVTFTFPSSPVFVAGDYFVTLTENTTIASNALPLTATGTTPFPIVETMLRFVNPTAYAGHNSQRDMALTLIGNNAGTGQQQGFWFTITGATAAAVALTTSPIDVSTSSAKELYLYETWHNSSILSSALPWGWFLTTNSTLPTQASYSPLNDPNVAIALVVYPNVGATSKNYYEYMEKNPGQNLLSASGLGTNPYPACPQSSTVYLCAGAQTGASSTNFFSISSTLNYTGNAANSGANGFSLLCVDSTPSTNPPASAFCSSVTQTPTLSPCSTGQNICGTTTLPFLNIQSGPFYLGFWSSAGQSATIQFGTSNTGAAAQRANSVWYWVPTPTCPPTCAQTDTGGFFGWLGKTLGGAYNAAAGALAPITGPILNAGNSLMNAVASALIQAGNLLIKGLTVLEGILQSTMNTIGNAVGLGNVGTDFFNILNAVITFFSSGSFNSIFTNAPALFARLIDSLSIYFPWLPTVLSVAASIASLGINSIGFLLTIIGFAFTFVSGAFATYLIAFWFIYTGDDSIAGVLAMFETTEYLLFGLGLKYLAYLINFSLDVVTNLIGLIPKPLVQMVAHQFPRIPIVDVNARFVWPSGQMTEIKNGNMLAAACWVSGILFLDMYETASPALPGSIGFLLPSALSALQPMAGFIPLLEVMTAFVWGAAFLMVPINWLTSAFDFGEVPFDSAVGSRTSGGLGGIRFTKASKRFQGGLEKKIAARSLGTGKTNVKRFEKLGISRGSSGENIN